MSTHLNVYAGPALIVPAKPHPFDIIQPDSMRVVEFGEDGELAMISNHTDTPGDIFHPHYDLPEPMDVNETRTVNECCEFEKRYRNEIDALVKHHGVQNTQTGWFVFGFWD